MSHSSTITPVQGARFQLRNVLSNWGAFAFAAVVNFALAPVVVHALGDTAYGVWSLLVSLTGYLGLLDLGVRGAVTRYVANFHSRSQHAEAGRLASAALLIFSVAGVLALIGSAALAVVVSELFRLPEELTTVARVVLLIGGVNVAISLVSGVFGGIVVGRERFDYNNVTEMVIGALRAVAIVIALKAGRGLVALASIQLAVSLLRGLASWWLSRRLYPELRVRLGEWDRECAGLIFSFGLTSVLLNAMGSIILYSDSLVIGAFLPVGMITFFAIAANLTEYARALISGISHTVMPRASALEAVGQQQELQEALLHGARLAVLVILPIVITFLLRGASFIRLWMGPEYVESAGAVLQILSLSLWSLAAYQIVTAATMGMGKQQSLIPAFVAEALLNLALSIVWVRRYGILGVAWGTTVPRLAASLLFAPWFVRNTLGVPARRFWLHVVVRPLVAVALFAAGSHAVEQLWPASSLLLYFVQVGATLPLALVGVWIFGLTTRERQTCVALLSPYVRGVFGSS